MKDRPNKNNVGYIFAYMYYIIDKPALLESIKEEVSHVADEAYSEDGAALYDSVMVTDRDKARLERFIDDAVSQFVRREFDITKYSPETYTDEFGEVQLSDRMRLQFFVPDFDETMAEIENNTITGGALKKELDRYIVLFSVASLFQQRRVALVPEYNTRTQSAMDKAVSLLKFRKHPVTQW